MLTVITPEDIYYGSQGPLELELHSDVIDVTGSFVLSILGFGGKVYTQLGIAHPRRALSHVGTC